MLNLGNNFFEYSISLLHESGCGHPFLNGLGIYFWGALAVMHCMYIICLLAISISGLSLF